MDGAQFHFPRAVKRVDDNEALHSHEQLLILVRIVGPAIAPQSKRPIF
jgi:hypothetical protein